MYPDPGTRPFLASVLDLGSRRLLGYSMAEHMRVLHALGMAIAARGDEHAVHGVIAHADRLSLVNTPTTTTSTSVSTSTGGCAARLESFWESLKRECVHGRVFATRTDARRAIFRWIIWYNTSRLHSSLEHVPPLEWKQHYLQAS